MVAPDDCTREVDPMTARRLADVAWVFLRLGCTSFGGPVAHLGYFRAELVDRRAWIDDARFGDLVALCQFLPGPASSQVVFALGQHRAGLAGALLASTCFTLPSALLMIAFAAGVSVVEDLGRAGFVHGLKLAAAAVVAQAVWGMGKKLCPDATRRALCVAAAASLVVFPGALAQLTAIALGALVGVWRYRGAFPVEDAPPAPPMTRAHPAALAALVTFAALLVVLPAAAAATGSRALDVVDAFYRAGAAVFGGGHVVLPLLRAEVVPAGWLTDDQFLAGYGAAQAVPGPLFTFAAYVGAVMGGPRLGWASGLACLLAIFLPAWLLVGGALPFWDRLRAKQWARAALAGANAVVVGVLLAALYDPVVMEGVHDVTDGVVTVVALVLLERLRAPPWLIVVGAAALGQWVLPR